MSFAFDSGEALPNANVPRIREYAKIMTQVSDLVEAIETTATKTDLDNNFTIDVEKKPGIMIPEGVSRQIGEVSFITAKLSLAVDTMHEDDEALDDSGELFVDHYSNDPTYESSIPADKAVVREATNISLQFFGSQGVFLASRTNLTKDTNSIQDHVSLVSNPRGVLVPVDAIPDRDLAALIISTVNPDAVNNYPEKPIDMTSPEAFSALSTLLATTTQSDINDSIRYMPEPDTHFKHRQQFDPKTNRMKTSFQIRYRSNEEPERFIIATHSLDTNFQLSFKTITSGGPFTPEALEDTPKLIPYEPTLDELIHLTEVLTKEVAAVNTRGLEVEIEDLDALSDDEAITQEPLFAEIEETVDTDRTFEEIAEEDNRRDFRHIADIAITSELEHRLGDIDPEAKE